MLVHNCALNLYFHSFLFRKVQVKGMDDIEYSPDTSFSRFDPVRLFVTLQCYIAFKCRSEVQVKFDLRMKTVFSWIV